MPSNGDNVPMLQPVRGDQLFVDKRTILALQVNQHKAVFQGVNFGVMTGYSRIFDDHLIGFPPADGDGTALFEFIFGQGPAF